MRLVRTGRPIDPQKSMWERARHTVTPYEPGQHLPLASLKLFIAACSASTCNGERSPQMQMKKPAHQRDVPGQYSTTMEALKRPFHDDWSVAP
jgi:hypothetical protein